MTDVLKSQFLTFSHYNSWANKRLFTACGELSDTEYTKKRPAFFGSLHGVLNHSLVADRIFVGFLTGRDSGLTTLDEQLYGDFLSLSNARSTEDSNITALIEDLGYKDLVSSLHYQWADKSYEQPLNLFLANLFNHQTHHRGQAHDLLSQTNVAPPPLDMFEYLLEIGIN